MSYIYRSMCQTRSVHCRTVLYHFKNTNSKSFSVHVVFVYFTSYKQFKFLNCL